MPCDFCSNWKRQGIGMDLGLLIVFARIFVAFYQDCPAEGHLLWQGGERVRTRTKQSVRCCVNTSWLVLDACNSLHKLRLVLSHFTNYSNIFEQTQFSLSTSSLYSEVKSEVLWRFWGRSRWFECFGYAVHYCSCPSWKFLDSGVMSATHVILSDIVMERIELHNSLLVAVSSAPKGIKPETLQTRTQVEQQRKCCCSCEVSDMVIVVLWLLYWLRWCCCRASVTSCLIQPLAFWFCGNWRRKKTKQHVEQHVAQLF